MGHWLQRNVVEPGKLPMLLALLSFVVCFLLTRTVTRLIRAGKGPFRNVTPGGLHIHHVVPGVVLTVIGGFGAVGTGTHGAAAGAFAVVFGVGAGLVLDEFALILHLDDVYWTEQGRQSVEVVVMAAALAALALGGFAPLGVDSLTADEQHDRAAAVAAITVNCLFAVVTFLKGKPRLGLIGVLVPFVALVTAVRLARPGSPWAKRAYRRRPRARARATLRAYRHDARWTGPRRAFQNWLGGTPDPSPPAPQEPRR
ncbi:hypothetical protein [Streptomyces tremellae]|uniref:Integral membrane protein n=1 Tax=Streptomyces tremellae TaxID=1124239 RepID=A0ABP7FYS9_9ACTN